MKSIGQKMGNFTLIRRSDDFLANFRENLLPSGVDFSDVPNVSSSSFIY
jgi:hypothetical protein